MGSEVDYKIIEGHYLLGGGQEANKYEFKIYRGHPDFEKITVDSVCWTFYQAEDVLTPIPAIIRSTCAILSITCYTKLMISNTACAK